MICICAYMGRYEQKTHWKDETLSSYQLHCCMAESDVTL